MARSSFSADYYRRFYLDPRTRVITREETDQRAAMVAALMKQLELPVRTILDAGCGLGWMRRGLLRGFPNAKYSGLEVSEHLCERFGWTQGSLASFAPRARYDLVICCDVVQYLPDREAAKAIRILARACRGALFFHTPTREDWRRNADHKCSDSEVHLRSTAWYREQLARHFRHAGFGLYVRRGVPFMQWELHKAAL